ncbi:hypothetical protein AVEN_43399-1 [Araneus ventricosus]|uniref:Uncharacterized protein n=1 Tax=Araneus ventricosus TaxID=182803 RepID=A0A4Y2JKH1_ARAVE|nr:hypothetical protein AVEN_43399-1 [Araneus ventricosus]
MNIIESSVFVYVAKLPSYGNIVVGLQHGAQLTSFLARTADETLKSFQWINTTQYHSASNSLLAHTANRTPKTFALQGDSSRSTFAPSSKRSPYIVFPGMPRRHMETSSTFKRISSPNRDIEKIPAPLRSHISSPRWSPSLSPRTNQFVTGHGPVVTYLHRFGLCSHDRYVCGDEGDPNHYAAVCPVTKPFHFTMPSAENLSTWCENIVQEKYCPKDPWHDS